MMLKIFFAAIPIKYFFIIPLFLSLVRLSVIRLFCILLFAFCQPARSSGGLPIAYCQLSKIDSLQHIVKTAKADTAKVNALNQLAMEFRSNNPDTSIYFAHQALIFSEKIKFKKGIAEAYLWMGTAIINLGKYDSALNYLSKALAEKTDKKITSRIYNNIGLVYWYQGNYLEALKNHSASLKIRKEIEDKPGIAASYDNIGNVYIRQGNYPEALKKHFAAVKIREEIGDKKGIAASYNNIGVVYYNQGSYPEALKNYFASLKIREEIGDKQGVTASYNNIGNVYHNQGNYSEALKNYFVSLKIKEEIGDNQGIADLYNNIGNVYCSQGNYPEALKNYFAALKIEEEIGDKQGIADLYNNIGFVYQNQGNYPEALKNHFASLKIEEEIGSKMGIVASYNNIGNVYTFMSKANEGIQWQEKALKLSKEIGYKEFIRNSYARLARADSILATSPLTPLQRRGEFAMSALENYKMYVLYKDSLINEETIKKTEREKNQYEFDKKETAAAAERQKKEVIAEAERRKQQIILWSVSGGLLLVVLFAGFIFRSYRQKQKANTIITQQKAEVEEQKKVVEEKNKDILDSIHYAKRIQDALLKAEEHVSEHLPEHFILFMPKDIVSGDFYWAYEKIVGSNSQLPTYWYIAAVDCTGHGVPGAFMSMLGMSFLNDIISSGRWLSAAEATPAEILNQLRDKVVKELRQTGEAGGSKDGMDISLARLELSSPNGEEQGVRLQWAGANNALNIIQNGQLREIKADKQPIGYHPASKAFTNHEIQLQKGDSIYIFSDGYADQFGGPKAKKFKYKQLEELVLTNSHLPMEEQKHILKRIFIDWRGALEQVDDVCVIGVRV